jgi:hypothetical protein
MTTRKLRWAALALFMALNACTGLANASQPDSSPCEADQWAIVPTKVFTLPGGVGFKLLYVTLAIENNSRYWGQIDTTAGDPIRQSYLTSEGGEESPALQQVQVETELRNLPQMNSLRYISSQLYTRGLRYIPPGFRLRGEAMISFEAVEAGYGTPSTWSQAVYRVAEQQNPRRITIPALTVTCIQPDGLELRETTGPIYLEVEEDIRQPGYPTSRPDSEFASITQPIRLPNQEALELQDIDYEAGMAGIRYLVIDFMPADTGEPAENLASFRPVLIGDDGLSRRITHIYGPPGCNPGPSATLRLCYHIGNQAANFKLVWVEEESGIFQVFDLPKGY